MRSVLAILLPILSLLLSLLAIRSSDVAFVRPTSSPFLLSISVCLVKVPIPGHLTLSLPGWTKRILLLGSSLLLASLGPVIVSAVGLQLLLVLKVGASPSSRSMAIGLLVLRLLRSPIYKCLSGPVLAPTSFLDG